MLCPHCQTQIPGKPVTCPNCKKKMRSLSLQNNANNVSAHLKGQAVRQQPIQQSYAQPPPMINNNSPYMQPMPQMQQMDYNQNMYGDPAAAKKAMIFACISLVAWIIPICGIPISIIGIVYGTKGRKTTAIVLCIITLVLTIINAIIGAVNAVS